MDITDEKTNPQRISLAYFDRRAHNIMTKNRFKKFIRNNPTVLSYFMEAKDMGIDEAYDYFQSLSKNFSTNKGSTTKKALRHVLSLPYYIVKTATIPTHSATVITERKKMNEKTSLLECAQDAFDKTFNQAQLCALYIIQLKALNYSEEKKRRQNYAKSTQPA